MGPMGRAWRAGRPSAEPPHKGRPDGDKQTVPGCGVTSCAHAPGVPDSGERRGLSRPSPVRPSRRGCRHRSERAGRQGAHNV